MPAELGSAGQTGPQAIDVDNLPNHEIPLAGKTAIVTGGSRDIGAAIVRSLTREGVSVVFSCKNQRRGDSVVDKITAAGGQVKAFATNMSTPEGRSAFFNSALETLGGSVDFLILSGSGRTPGENIELSEHMLDLTLPHMPKGSSVVKLQSIPGHFAPQLEGSFSGGIYEAIAANKYPDAKSVRRRMQQMGEHKVRYIEICPPMVEDTFNYRGFRRLDPELITKHAKISKMLGLPVYAVTTQVGDKIAELLSNPGVRSGHTEFFGGVSDVQTPLERIYGIPQIYVNTLEIKTQADDINTKVGIGRAIVSLKQTERANEPNMIDGLRRDLTERVIGEVTITPEHANGHFARESGLPQILPGHKQIRLAVEAIRASQQAFGKSTDGVRLVGFESAEFSSVILADGNTDLLIIPTKKSDGTYDVEILRESNGEKTAFIRGLKVRPATESDTDTLLEDQAIEGAAQATGVVGIKDLDGTNMPLLRSIGRVEFVAGGIKAGEGIKYDVSTQQNGARQIEGAVVVHSEGRIIANISDIRASLVPQKVVSRILR